MTPPTRGVSQADPERMRKVAMWNRPIEGEGWFYARMSDDDVMLARFGISAVFMEIDTRGDVRRFIGVDDEEKPIGRWPSRGAPPFMFAHGLFSEDSVADDELISAAEFEAKWAEAEGVVGQHAPWATPLTRLIAAARRRCRGE